MVRGSGNRKRKQGETSNEPFKKRRSSRKSRPQDESRNIQETGQEQNMPSVSPQISSPLHSSLPATTSRSLRSSNEVSQKASGSSLNAQNNIEGNRRNLIASPPPNRVRNTRNIIRCVDTPSIPPFAIGQRRGHYS